MNEVAASAEPRARRPLPRWLLVALFVSLGANLLVIGSVGASMWRFHRLGPPPSGGPASLLGYASSLKGDRYKAVWDATSAQRARLHPVRMELRAARAAVTAAIGAEPFDQTAFEAAQVQLIDKEHEARRATLALYVEIVKHLTPEERRDYARWRERRRLPPVGILDDGGPGNGPPFRSRRP